MDLMNIGAQMYRSAQANADAAAHRIVKGASEGGPDPGDMVDMMKAGDEAAIAGKVIQAGRKMDGTLLDIFA
ncbi:MAG: hypothetical protein JNL94_17470 [Planctomycetes bacterium]|nr:hypothetical protein [Planctomycetota bacterium]